ncbi:aminotransferase class IV [Maribacter litoralis]|uniref:D-alanine transaminase n=1 Tax=Maribacter litoralis TaxID=2059726 RepID=A0A653X007_9FLAO|nr:aminotransferase class IV [Maribacter litoralis]VXC24605.1 D-alanine transaminase [Maribacter litoralis]
MAYPEKVYLNGEIKDAHDAKISVFDRGFIFGDGIYEVIANINGRLFYYDAHLDRLKDGLKKINIEFDTSSLPKAIDALISASNLKGQDYMLYIQITRGVAPRKHAYPETAIPTVMMFAFPKTLPDNNEVNAQVITRNDFRWSRCDIKMTSLLGNVMLNDEAKQHDCYETIMHRNGVFTEGSHCNLFFVKNGTVFTHPADEFILNGITRIAVLELCKSLNIEVKETPIKTTDLLNVDEAFLTGTTVQIASIQQIDDHILYTENKKGSVTKKLQEAFLKLKYTVTPL